jgi:hypothetical protein
MKTCRFLSCILTCILLSAFSARANVFASDIRFNGSLPPFTNKGPVTITYHLNEPATLGVKIAIMSGTTNIATLQGTTAMGLNTVVWGATNSLGTVLSNGVFSISITAATGGASTWHQISVDSNPGMTAYFPLGIAVDNNTNSPYYGRVVMGCALEGTTASEKVGLYKMNADGTIAEEGWYGDASYTNDDGGDPQVAGQMPGTAPFNVNPMKIRIGDDDRIYWVDNSYLGAIIATDMEATTNQVVINEQGYQDNPDLGNLEVGFQEFDVTGTTTTNAAVWLCDNDSPNNWGIWMYHLSRGTSDLSDEFGVQAVTVGADLSVGSSGGCMIDTNFDIFCGQDIATGASAYNAMEFAKWNGGVLPALDTTGTNAFTYAVGATNDAAWEFGCSVDSQCTNNPGFQSVRDVVINSRLSPTMVACPMSVGANNGAGGGIRVLNATNGSVITVTNAGVVQTLTNLDWTHAYTCAAWDNVGNLYGASTNLNLWRVWSPPGPNTNLTYSAGSVVLSTNAVVIGPPPSSTLKITSIARAGGTITILFSATNTASASQFTLQSASVLKGPFSAVTGATITGSAGSFSVSTSTNGLDQFYRIEE